MNVSPREWLLIVVIFVLAGMVVWGPVPSTASSRRGTSETVATPSDLPAPSSPRQRPVHGRPARDAAARPPYWAAIRTNGVIVLPDPGTPDATRSDQLRCHVQLRALLHSPARDTEECHRVAALVTAYGYPLELVPMAYRHAWQRYNLNRSLAGESFAGEREMRLGMEDSDFRLLLERSYGGIKDGFIDALVQIQPEVSFGFIHRGIAQGEPRLE